jgi:hypothetical protein
VVSGKPVFTITLTVDFQGKKLEILSWQSGTDYPAGLLDQSATLRSAGEDEIQN